MSIASIPHTKLRNSPTARALAAALTLLAGTAAAQDVDVRGDAATNGGIVLQGKNINPNTADYIGVQGLSEPGPFFGIGVQGRGGYKGVQGLSTVAGTGSRYGVIGMSSGGLTFNYGLYGSASGASGTNYGVYASGSGVNSRGVYATASGNGSRAGYFLGSLEYTGSLIGPSDAKLKKNVAPLRNAVSRLTKLSPKEFEYRSDEYATMRLPKTHQVGLIAQDVEAVFPDLVEENVVPEAEPGDEKVATAKAAGEREKYKGVNYIGLIPVLISAIKEQQEEINALKKALQRPQ